MWMWLRWGMHSFMGGSHPHRPCRWRGIDALLLSVPSLCLRGLILWDSLPCLACSSGIQELQTNACLLKSMPGHER